MCLIKRSTEVIQTQWQNFLQDPRSPSLSASQIAFKLAVHVISYFKYEKLNKSIWIPVDVSKIWWMNDK